MSVTLRFAAALVVASFLHAPNAWAQSQLQIDWCIGTNDPMPDLTIAGCNAVINSGNYSGHSLAVAYNNRAIAYQAVGQYDRSIQDSDQAIRLDPNYARAVYNRGFTNEKQGQDDRALADYSQAIRLDPDFGSAFNNRGSVFYRRGQYDRALQDYDRAIELDIGNANIYYNRSLAKRELGDSAGATEDYNTAVRMDPGIEHALKSGTQGEKICWEMMGCRTEGCYKNCKGA